MAAILIVEADGLVAQQTAEALRQIGHTLLLAPTARAALEEVRPGPNLILLDLDLPDIPGEEILRRLRLQPRTAQVPIVVITGKQGAAAQVRESEMEYADLLLKPVSAARLLQAVASALGAPGGQESAAVRSDEFRRRELMQHLVVEGPHPLAAQVYRRLCADRMARGDVPAQGTLSWQEIAQWAVLEGLLNPEQASLLHRPLDAQSQGPEPDSA